jgi:hypothetical protein
MKSRGDSVALGTEATEARLKGLFVSWVGGGVGSCMALESCLAVGEAIGAFDRKLGIGSAEGAGEAWNVAPAKAAAVPAFIDVGRCGVDWRPCPASGELG